MNRIGVFVDVSNLYYCIKKKYNGRKLSYKKYLDYVKDLGTVVKATAYGCRINDEAKGFIFCLKETGFETKFKTVKTFSRDTGVQRKADWDVGIAIDIVRTIKEFDMIVLGTADGDLEPVVDWCMENAVDVIVVACGISRDLKKRATEFIEIPESLLEDKK